MTGSKPDALPLADAQRRLGRHGRPRKHLKSGHSPGTGGAELSAVQGPERGALACRTIAPRLLDLHATAVYLGVSGWTVRDLEAAGTLRRVRVPLVNGGELRKLLFDRGDLDRLVEAWKDAE